MEQATTVWSKGMPQCDNCRYVSTFFRITKRETKTSLIELHWIEQHQGVSLVVAYNLDDGIFSFIFFIYILILPILLILYL